MTDEALALRLHHRVRHGVRSPRHRLEPGRFAIVCGPPLNFLGQKLWSFAR